MPAPYIHIYKDNPTSGGTDGTLVSEGTEGSPISAGPINPYDSEVSSPIKLALRCQSMCRTSGNTVLTPVGDTAGMWALAPDNAGSPGAWQEYGASLTISSVINDTNYIFWVKARSQYGENTHMDISVNIRVQATVVPV